MYKNKSKGKLFYDFKTERIDVLYDDGTREGGLHCGATFEVKLVVNGCQQELKWVRIGI